MDAVLPFLDRIELLLVMTQHPGRGGQQFIHEVLSRMAFLRDEIERRGLDVPIAVDGGVNLETIGAAHAAGGEEQVEAGPRVACHRQRPSEAVPPEGEDPIGDPHADDGGQPAQGARVHRLLRHPK